MRTTFNHKALLMIITGLLLFAGGWAPSHAADGPNVLFGPSDADRIAVYSGLPTYQNFFWWDHTDLTIAVTAAPNVDPQMITAIHQAIETWRVVLATRFPIVSLRDVTGTVINPQMADITIHFIPTAGGIKKSGNANCGVQRCSFVMIRSDLPDNAPEADYDPVRIYKTTLHEIGHTLGLGHATPIAESQDLMGYGWIYADPDLTPILSDCDLSGIAAVFAWAVNGEQPHAATVGSVPCR